jgi:hypothetical protein
MLTHLHLVPRFRIRVSTSVLPLYTFIMWAREDFTLAVKKEDECVMYCVSYGI